MKQPKNPFNPGEILLEEFLKPDGITQLAFAKKLGWTRARLNELIDPASIPRTPDSSSFEAAFEVCR